MAPTTSFSEAIYNQKGVPLLCALRIDDIDKYPLISSNATC
jgi:hypothetical protein